MRISTAGASLTRAVRSMNATLPRPPPPQSAVALSEGAGSMPSAFQSHQVESKSIALSSESDNHIAGCVNELNDVSGKGLKPTSPLSPLSSNTRIWTGSEWGSRNQMSSSTPSMLERRATSELSEFHCAHRDADLRQSNWLSWQNSEDDELL